MKGELTLAGNRWSSGPMRFARPFRVIAAGDPGEVMSALQEAQSAASEGCWVAGFVGYEAAPGFDRRLSTHPGDDSVPLLWFGVYDHPEAPLFPVTGQHRLGEWRALMSADSHAGRVASIRESIRMGDTYQVNLTFPMEASFVGDAGSLFAAMLDAQPDSYGAIIDLGTAKVVSVSPELFFKLSGGMVWAIPMKGTAPRGRWPEEDLARADELSRSEKERAGNVMIVDLIRNDLGRVAEVGSVEVPELFSIERHPTVWQMTSTVTARMGPGRGVVDMFQAAFPSGSVTGAPKPSTMSVITEHEIGPRGPYCGAIGYIAPGGEDAEFSVAIRTGLLTGDMLVYHVGGGITFDSLAGSEYDECLWKALVVTEHPTRPSLLETMRYEPGTGIALADRHLARLASSADYWGIVYDPAAIRETLSAVEAEASSRVRLVLDGDGNVELSIEAIEPAPIPVELRLSDVRVDPENPAWYHKTADRARYPITEPGTEAILMNLRGEVTETNRSNIFVRLSGRWVTPGLESGCLPGVFRSMMIDDGKASPGSVTWDQLASATEIAVTNAVGGWRNARLIE